MKISMLPEPSVANVYAEALYDGISAEPKFGALLHLRQGKIESLKERVEPINLPFGTIRASIATPGLIDLQINGAGDVQFNLDLTLKGLEKMVWASARGGAAYIFPAFMTASGNDYQDAVAVVMSALNNGAAGVAGIHLEGPFISEERSGIHRPDFIRAMTADDVDFLCKAAQQIKILLTVAPERQDPALLRRLHEARVILFAGHSNATSEEMRLGSNAGITGATHLFNAMSQTSGHRPGVVGTVMGEPGFFASIIADGHHVHASNVTIAARAIPDRLCLVTDAMQTMNGKTTSFEIYGERISLKDGKLTQGDGTIGGAHLTMSEAVINMAQFAGIPFGEAVAMASANPAKAMGLEENLGCVSVGKTATLSLFDADFRCRGIVRDGQLTSLVESCLIA